jgi:ATP-dependent RNA helicase RhlE
MSQPRSAPPAPSSTDAPTFASLALDPRLLRAVEEMGFSHPTPIQQQSIPPALKGGDVLACAMTGSGKTAAFLLPILNRLLTLPRGTTRVLVLAPTRELAAQIEAERAALCAGTGLTGASIFGGVSIGPQEQAFRKGVDILTATPGRLLDHFQYDYARLAGVETVVLDEADRMLDMGFLPEIRKILKRLPQHRHQTFFFSATLPPPTVELAREMLRAPTRIDVERKQAPATGITQALFPVPQQRKPDLLIELLRRDEIGNVIVFCRTKHRANRLFQRLERAGITVARIHGNRSQKQRTEALDGFKKGAFQVLAATDIVARGIDVDALDHVVNFDVPAQPEDYIHRVGRTARAGQTGEAYTFVSPEEERDVQAIERAVGARIPRRTLEGFDYSAREEERFEVPVAERIAAIRSQRADERARAREKADRKTKPTGAQPKPSASTATGGSGNSGNSGNPAASGSSGAGGGAQSRATSPSRRRRGGGRGGSGRGSSGGGRSNPSSSN